MTQHPAPGADWDRTVLLARLATIELRVLERLPHAAFCRRAPCGCVRGVILRLCAWRPA